MSEHADSTRLSATALPLLYVAASMAAFIGVVLIAWQPVVGAMAFGVGMGQHSVAGRKERAAWLKWRTLRFGG